MPTEDQETSTILQVRCSEASPTNHTMIASTATMAKSTLWSKSIRPNSASTTWRTRHAHSINIANSLTVIKNSEQLMILFHRALERQHLVQFTPTTRLSHANTWSKRINVHSVKDAHSTTMMRRKESWLTHFQIFQKVSLSHQCQRNRDTHTRVDTIRTTVVTPTNSTTMTLPIPTLPHLHQSVHSNSAHWTLNHHPWSRSPASLKWLLLVASTQTSIWAQPQSPCQPRSKDSISMDSNHKCSSHKCPTLIRIRVKTLQLLKEIRTKEGTRTTTTRRTSSKEAQRRTLSTDMRRRKVKTERSKRLTRTKARKSTSPSKRRPTNLTNLKLLQNLRLQPKLSKLPHEQDIRSWRSEHEKKPLF